MNIFKMVFVLLSLAKAVSAAVQPAAINLQYSEFKKILTTKSSVFPLPGGKESLMLMKMSTDEYAKVYKLNHETKTFEMQYDAGQNISVLTRDSKFKRYFLLIDKLGDENLKIYDYDVEKRSAKFIFGHKGFRVSQITFPENKDVLYILSNHENKGIYSAYRLDLNTNKFEQITDGKESWDSLTVSPDEKNLVLTQNKSNNEIHVFLLETNTKKVTPLFAKAGTTFDPTFFHPQKSLLYLNSNDGRDRMGCASVDITKGPKSFKWVRIDSRKELSCGYESESNVTTIYEDYEGQIHVRILSGVFGVELPSPIPQKVIASSFSILPKEDWAFLRLVSSKSPGDIYRFRVSQGKKATLEKISQLNMSAIDDTQFGESFDIYYKSFDGLKIHGIIFAKKEWLKDGSKHPVIVWPHGGPDWLAMHDWSPYFQYWVLNGYVVFAPNFRGSTGYGKKFETLNDRDWGGGHIKDLIWGKREMAKKSYVDPARMYIVGRSFGGFSTLSTITQYPKEFRAAVAIVAIGNLFTFFKSIPPDPAWQNEFLTEMGDPVKDEKLYRERSPYFHAEKIAIPLKIYQAENDVRTVKAEMDNFVDKLKEHKIPVDYEILENEGHMPSRDETWQKLLQGTIEFLNKN